MSSTVFGPSLNGVNTSSCMAANMAKAASAADLNWFTVLGRGVKFSIAKFPCQYVFYDERVNRAQTDTQERITMKSYFGHPEKRIQTTPAQLPDRRVIGSGQTSPHVPKVSGWNNSVGLKMRGISP